MDSLPYVFHGETLRGFDGGSRALLPPSKHWVPGSCVTHFEGMASKPKRCQFRRLWTAFHTFSMEKHYEALMVEAGPYFHHQSIGYQGAVSHILKGWRRSPNVSIQKIMDSLPYVFHGETLRGFDGGSRALLPPSKHWVPGAVSHILKGWRRTPNRVNSEDYGQPSIRFPWRNTTMF